jgi:transposase
MRLAAERTHIDPDGRSVTLSERTVEAWFYAWRRGGLEALKDEPRVDSGRSRIPPEVQDRLRVLKLERPRRSIRRLIRILELAGEVREGELTRSSVHRFLRAEGISARSRTAEPVERRAFRHREPGELWMGDVLHGPQVLASGRVRKPLPIEELRSRIWGWLAAEYNSRVHTATGRVPLEHWLSAASTLRPVPPGLDLDEVFLHRERRVVRKDGTVRFAGRFLEVRAGLIGKEVELRFDPFGPEKLPRVFLEGKFFCDTVALDAERNAYEKRHRPKAGGREPGSLSSGLDPLRLFQEEQLRRARLPEPPPWKTDDDDSNDTDTQTEIHAHV